MTGKSTYVEVSGWASLMHYRHREPTWIKLHVSLLRDERYLRLTPHQRAVFHGICLVYARTNGRVPAASSSLNRWLGFRVTRKTLRALVDAGFIVLRDPELTPC
jgi:hypothetical protein